MAAPHIAGAAAMLLQEHPTWKPAELKARADGSAKSPSTDVVPAGCRAGRPAPAIRQTVFAGPSSLSFGLVSWPHTDDKPETKEVTYRNLGDSGRHVRARRDVHRWCWRPGSRGVR